MFTEFLYLLECYCNRNYNKSLHPSVYVSTRSLYDNEYKPQHHSYVRFIVHLYIFIKHYDIIDNLTRIRKKKKRLHMKYGVYKYYIMFKCTT